MVHKINTGMAGYLF